MNKNCLNHIAEFQLKGSCMNKNCLNPITQLIGITLLVAGFVLLPLSRPALAANGTPGTPMTGTSGLPGGNGVDGLPADGASGGANGADGGTGRDGASGHHRGVNTSTPRAHH